MLLLAEHARCPARWRQTALAAVGLAGLAGKSADFIGHALSPLHRSHHQNAPDTLFKRAVKNLRGSWSADQQGERTVPLQHHCSLASAGCDDPAPIRRRECWRLSTGSWRLRWGVGPGWCLGLYVISEASVGLKSCIIPDSVFRLLPQDTPPPAIRRTPAKDDAGLRHCAGRPSANWAATDRLAADAVTRASA